MKKDRGVDFLNLYQQMVVFKDDPAKQIELFHHLITEFEIKNQITSDDVSFVHRKLKGCVGFYFLKNRQIFVSLDHCDSFSKRGDIIILRQNIRRSIVGTHLHEYGHFLNEYFEKLIHSAQLEDYNDSILINRDYASCYKKSEKYIVSNYLFTPAEPEEDFAETFIFFVMNPTWLEKKYPLKYTFFREFLGLTPLHDYSTSELLASVRDQAL